MFQGLRLRPPRVGAKHWHQAPLLHWYARRTFTPAPVLQTIVALVAIAAFLATDNPTPAAIIGFAGVVAWVGYLIRRRRA
jgi:hypothetical protein